MKIYRRRKPLCIFRWICAVAAATLFAGCFAPRGSTPQKMDSPVKRIRISAITEFLADPIDSEKKQINTLVEVFDTAGSSVKIPCTLRFELYELQPLSSNPRGHRLIIWQDYNLNDSVENDEYWNTLLRGYELFLPLDFLPQEDKKYVLEVTCMVNQRRFNDVLKLEYRR